MKLSRDSEVEWDSKKAASNLRKHRISFEEAKSVFVDSLASTWRDDEHSSEEQRFLTIGCSSNGRVLLVGYAERGDRLRIFSARLATKHERKNYEQG